MAATKVDPLWSPEDVAAYCLVPVPTVYRWRQARTGPRGIRVGKHIRYRRADVEAWLDSKADPNGAPR